MDKTRLDGDFLALLNTHRGAIERVSRTYTSTTAEREDAQPYGFETTWCQSRYADEVVPQEL